jgi:hypothetical protein
MVVILKMVDMEKLDVLHVKPKLASWVADMKSVMTGGKRERVGGGERKLITPG